MIGKPRVEWMAPYAWLAVIPEIATTGPLPGKITTHTLICTSWEQAVRAALACRIDGRCPPIRAHRLAVPGLIGWPDEQCVECWSRFPSYLLRYRFELGVHDGKVCADCAAQLESRWQR